MPLQGPWGTMGPGVGQVQWPRSILVKRGYGAALLSALTASTLSRTGALLWEPKY